MLPLGQPTNGSAGPGVGPLAPPFGLVLYQLSIGLEIWCLTKTFLEKMFQFIFQRIFKLGKYFFGIL